jgi:hypothetical protein
MLLHLEGLQTCVIRCMSPVHIAPSIEFRNDHPLTGRQRELLAWRRSRVCRQSCARRQDLGVARFAGRHCFPRTGLSSNRPSRPPSDMALSHSLLCPLEVSWQRTRRKKWRHRVLRQEGSGAVSTALNRGPGEGPPQHDSRRPVFHRCLRAT